jgi:hypothetical protein
MSTIVTTLLLIAGQPVERDRAIVDEANRTLRDCYSKINTVRVKYTERRLESLPIPKDLLPGWRAPVRPLDSPREFEIIEGPARRYEYIESDSEGDESLMQRSVSRFFFDGTQSTRLNEFQKVAVLGTHVPELKPLAHCPLHAFGWRVPSTLETSLDAFFSEPKNVTYKGQEPIDGLLTHAFEVSPIPREIRPDASDAVRAKSVVCVWLDPAQGFLPKRWRWSAFGQPAIPILAHFAKQRPDPSGPGRSLIYQFDVESYRMYADHGSERKIPFPERVRFTVPSGSLEWTVSEVAINPPLDAFSFRPRIPEGYRRVLDARSVRAGHTIIANGQEVRK